MTPLSRPEPAVPSFFLFGEPPRTVEGRFLHLESLDDRSRPNDWNIRAHAHADLNHVFHIAAGRGAMHIEGEVLPFAAPCLLIVPARIVHGFAYEAETSGRVLTIADSYLRDLMARDPSFGSLFKSPLALALAEGSDVDEALSSLGRELVWSAPGHLAAVEGHLLRLLVEALRLIVRAEQVRSANRGAHAVLVARFRELIELHYRSSFSLEDYAAELAASPARLRAACRKVAGVSPMTLVRDRLMFEARRSLVYSNMTVAEVAYHLGYSDPAYFTRHFTKLQGCSPRAFRQSRDRTLV